MGVRSNDPHTSAEGYAKVDAKALMQLVVDTIRRNGAGMTIDELTDATGAQKVSLSPRMKPLETQGLVRRADFTRKGRAGVSQTVWELTFGG